MSIQNLNRKFAATFVVAAALGLTACAGHSIKKDDMMADDMKKDGEMMADDMKKDGEMMADDMKKDGEMMADDMKKDGEMMSDDDTMMDGDGK